MSYFKKRSVETHVNLNTSENIIPYNGFSFYKIVYKGVLPEFIADAYQQMENYNSSSPRKRFEKLREKIRKTLNIDQPQPLKKAQ